MIEPTSTKPYLLRAIYEWCVDNGLTPYVSVAVDANTRVPMEYVRDGEIVLNIGPLATSNMQMGNDSIRCTARFSGVSRELAIPVAAVTAIYARENGQGMSFDVGPEGRSADPGASASEPRPGPRPAGDPGTDPEPPTPPKPGGSKPNLRRIK
ncbi:MAG: ClpXP protease specificity-enhancing factor [Betaproteobacteria bacterium]|nr:ClpXP protease specificity-enhancing factor [Betaproteobacteria bacterium]